MIPIYVALVRNGLRTIDQVPAPIRDDVKAALGVKEEEPAQLDASTGAVSYTHLTLPTTVPV